MRLLLDTHAFLWFAIDDAKLSQAARSAMIDLSNALYVSPASIWELAIKVGLRKYSLPAPFQTCLHQLFDEFDINLLPILVAHAAQIVDLPFHHRDPFDRMLFAQSIVERLGIISADDILDRYGVQRIW